MIPKSAPSIVIITVYFGKLPWYLTYFLHSCAFNPTVDFIILTDDQTKLAVVPKNVVIKFFTIDEFNARIQTLLGLDFAVDNPYKLCDFKPAFGVIFHELIRRYAFFGVGDIDVIFGNIRAFMTNQILQTNDVISVRHDYLAGYFTLYRNVPEIVFLFEKSRDYKKVFTTSKHYCFDECNFAFWNPKIDFANFDEDTTCEIESMTHVVRRMHKSELLRLHLNSHAIEGLPGRLTWYKGTLIYRGRFEVILYHLILFKKVYEERVPRSIKDSFRISPSSIY